MEMLRDGRTICLGSSGAETCKHIGPLDAAMPPKSEEQRYQDRRNCRPALLNSEDKTQQVS
jgi:hypothetical protein